MFARNRLLLIGLLPAVCSASCTTAAETPKFFSHSIRPGELSSGDGNVVDMTASAIPLAIPGTEGNNKNQKVALDPALMGALSQMRRAYEVGDDERAVLLERLAQKLDPPANIASYLDSFSRILYGRMLQRALSAAARVVPVKSIVSLGDALEFDWVLENPGIGDMQETLTLVRGSGSRVFGSSGRSQTQLFATVTTTDIDVYGTESSRTESLPVSLRENIVIAPGGSYSTKFQIQGFAGKGFGARRISVGAELLPAEAKFGDRVVLLHRIVGASAQLLVLPRGFEAIQDDPLTALGTWLGRGERQGDRCILAASLLLPERDRAKGVSLLRRALLTAGQSADQDAQLRARAIVSSLRQVTNERELGLDVAAWVNWASRNK